MHCPRRIGTVQSSAPKIKLFQAHQLSSRLSASVLVLQKHFQDKYLMGINLNMHRSFQISSYSGSMDARNWDEKARHESERGWLACTKAGINKPHIQPNSKLKNKQKPHSSCLRAPPVCSSQAHRKSPSHQIKKLQQSCLP